MIRSSILKISNLAFSSLLLNACVSYNSSFSCGDAKGVCCSSMDKVDLMISNGEIISFTEKKYNLKKKKKEEGAIKEVPEIKSQKAGNYLYP